MHTQIVQRPLKRKGTESIDDRLLCIYYWSEIMRWHKRSRRQHLIVWRKRGKISGPSALKSACCLADLFAIQSSENYILTMPGKRVLREQGEPRRFCYAHENEIT